MPISKPSRAGRSGQNFASVAVTGTAGFLGSTLLQALEMDPRIHHLVALDKQPPPFKLKKGIWAKVDFTETGVDQKLADIFKKNHCETLVHAALMNRPTPNLEQMHEIQSVGTMHLLSAAAAAKMRKLVLASTTEVYGAFPDNPNFLTENHPARGGALSAFLKDKVEVEEQYLKFGKENPKSCVTILRPATILGPTVNNFKTNFLQHPILPTVMGFDPLLQFVHEHDVTRAFLKVILENHTGIFNIVAKGVLPLSRTIRILGKVPVPIPSFLLYSSTELLWYLNMGAVPGSHIHFLKYLCVADGTKSWRELKFEPVFSSLETLMGFSGRDWKKETIALKLEEMDEMKEP